MNEALFGNVDAVETKLTIEGQTEGSVTVLAVRGTDMLSGVAAYFVNVVSSAETASKLDDALGREATLTIQRAEDPDSVHLFRGVVEEVFPEGVNVGRSQRRTQLLLVPRLNELRHRKRSFVYQDMTVVEIVEAIVKPWHVELDVRLSPEPKKREMCTQVNETDLAFLTRILADDGIHFHVEHGADKSTLVLVNDPLGYQPIVGTPEVLFRDAGGAITIDHVKSITRERRLRSGSVAHADYNFLSPETYMGTSFPEEIDMEPATLSKRELYEYPGAYNHPTGEDVGFQPDVQWPAQKGLERARQRLEEQRSDALTFSGRASCFRLRVGRTFTIADHPDKPFNKTFIITSIAIHGATGDVPTSGSEGGSSRHDADVVVQFTAVPSDTRIRPAIRNKPPAHVRKARVVGPKIDEPYVDEYGRIKIQYAWDRKGENNEKSSCWVRMMTPSAHHGQGTYIAHRVGAEVLVDFLDGDVDRPIVIGAMFHAENRQPQKLPDDATRAVLYKGLSVPGNKGNNELSIEDRAGHEEIFLHAERDKNQTVKRNHTESIGANHTESVGANQSVSVGANRTVSVGGNQTTTITKHNLATINEGDEAKIKKGRNHEIIDGDDELKVTAGDRKIEVAKLHKIQAKNLEEVITEKVDIAGGESLTFHHAKDSGLILKANEAVLTAQKKVTISTPFGSITFESGKIAIVADEEISLTCGSSSLTLKKDGTITGSGSKEIGLTSSNSSLKLEPAKAALGGAAIDVTAVGQTVIGGALIKIG